VIVFQDITQLKRREEALRTREQELDLLRQVQSRVLRHNIRNELTTVRGNAEVVEAVVDEAYEPRVQDIIEASDDLLSISAKARVVEEIIDEDKALVEYDLRRCVEEAIATIEEEHPAAELSLDGPENCSVQAAPQLGVAIENILENAIVHNDSPTPRVAVVIDGSEHPQVSVADDGPGIPEQEVAVIEDGAETSLEHGSGIGLWVVKWVANRSDARLAFDTSEEGTTVSLRFGKPVSETDIDPAPPRLSA
jgi:signal transduction histidine kinase